MLDIQPVRFRHDPRLLARSIISPSEEMTLSFMRRIRCPILFIQAEKGWPFDANMIENRIESLSCILYRQVVRGSHHVHLDDPEIIIPQILHFLQSLIDNPESKNGDNHFPRTQTNHSRL